MPCTILGATCKWYYTSKVLHQVLYQVLHQVLHPNGATAPQRDYTKCYAQMVLHLKDTTAGTIPGATPKWYYGLKVLHQVLCQVLHPNSSMAQRDYTRCYTQMVLHLEGNTAGATLKWYSVDLKELHQLLCPNGSTHERYYNKYYTRYNSSAMAQGYYTRY
jgi:hypothetical protein